MSKPDREAICKILNKTNFRIMAWYFGPKDAEQCGLKNCKLLHQMPMQSTGGEKFTVYIYYKTKKAYPRKEKSKSVEKKINEEERVMSTRSSKVEASPQKGKTKSD